MRRFLCLIGLIVGAAVSAAAQTTTVTATVKDANGNVYANGTVNANVVVNSGQPIPAGVPASGSTGLQSLSAQGTFSIVVASPLSWVFTICGVPLGLGPRGNPPLNPNIVCFTTGPISIAGGTQDITANLGVVPVLGPVNPVVSVASLQTNTISRACNGAANCQQIVGDVLQDTNATYSSGSAVITVSNVMPAFSPTNVIGKKGWVTGRCNNASEFSCNYDCKYGALTYVSATQVSLPANCTNSSSAITNANNFIFGTDDCTAVSTFFQSVFYPGGLNTLNPQVLNLPQGSFLSSCPPFVATSYPLFARWPLTIIGQNTQIYLPPTISSGLGSTVALYDSFTQDAVGSLGFSSFFSNFSFYCGGNDVHDTAGTLVNPSYYIFANGEDVFQNVYVNGCDWNVSSATPVYGWNCHGGQLHSSGTYAGGNFGMIASDLNGEPCNIFGGNVGGSENNSIIFAGEVNLYGVYLNQPQRSSFNNKLSYGLYGNTATAVLNDYGSSNANIWLDSGKAVMHGSNMGGFGSIYDFNLAGGTLVLNSVYTSANCNMTGGSLFDAAFNAAQGSLCPTGLTQTGGSIFGSSSITGTACATGNWALTSGWGTSSIASVTAGGDSHRCQVVITGAAGAAGPVLTWTFPKAYLQAPGSCQISFNGTLTGESTGVPTKTSVAFTFTGTPSAQTYNLDASCGP